jgi:hypothetical protein
MRKLIGGDGMDEYAHNVYIKDDQSLLNKAIKLCGYNMLSLKVNEANI